MVLRLVLGAIYTAMGTGQLASLGEMPAILGGYGLVNDAAATLLTVVLIVGELVCGVWFLARPRSAAIAPVWVYTAVSLVWGALAVQAFRTRAGGGQLRLFRELPSAAARLVRTGPGHAGPPVCRRTAALHPPVRGLARPT
ncbi:hypothetical protein GCM10022233_73650 [Streptomyces shaanxiensis]|uniref:Uncharacterized protein n=1 Tax=Streptomyces shaanxiensis TaxID=653357 RepID=A0ABP7W6Z0_9ACTN